MLNRIRSFLFENQSTGQTIAKNTFWLFSGEVFGRLIRFSVVIYATRILGPGEYGVFAYVMAIAAFMTIFSDIGLSAILTREAVKNPESENRYISTAFFLKLILIAVAAIVVLFIVPLFVRIEEARALLPLVTFIFIFDSLREFAFGLNRALEKMEREAVTKIIMNAAIAVLGLWFLINAPTAESLTTAYVLGTAGGLAVILWYLRKYVTTFFLHFDRKLLLPIFSLAWPIGLLGLLGALMLNTDMLMLGWWRSSVELGLYALSQKIILLLYVLPTLLASAFFPTFVRLAGSNDTAFQERLSKSITLSLLIGVPLTVGGIILAPQLVSAFGAQFIPAAPTLRILLTSLLVMYPSALLSNALVAYNRQKYFIVFVGVGAVANIIFNVLLIPSFGIEGAALSTLLTQTAANLLVWLQMKRVNRFSFLYRMPRILTSAGAMGGIALALSSFGTSLLLNIGISMLVYFGVLALLREPLLGELKPLFFGKSRA